MLHSYLNPFEWKTQICFEYTMLDIVNEILCRFQTGHPFKKKRMNLHTTIWKLNAKRITM